ncbi:hypothetical protein INT47_009904 [Mucor saturninus]|uniref:Brca1-associated protein n=1 Tax=Mucor saturninus TaxID=64648 RepID=A0A8H7QVS5_9FUNG|nr:hypothetical protein INT47_009904 [Mucor saturninus]
MANHKGSLVASVVSSTKKGHHDYGLLKIEHNEPTSIITSVDAVVLCTFAIPFHISIPDFLSFVAPVDSFVSHYRVIRDTVPDSYMVLMKFRDPRSANDYYNQYSNRLFSSMEPERCQVVYIESVESGSHMSPFPFPEADQESDEQLSACPVCLEPMMDTLTGLLTILCQHTFHCHCLSKWGDGSCPVCRYSQKKPSNELEQQEHKSTRTIPEEDRNIGDQEDPNECAVCKSVLHLWVCLICGYIGCGRYAGSHAYDHYTETSHLYALEIDTQRVWDYTGDGYVHRLIQNAVDGKLVELPSNTENEHAASQEKEEAIALEYNYLLTSQLDSQRIYYENQMEKVFKEISGLTMQLGQLTEKANEIRSNNHRVETENKVKEKIISDLEKGKEKADKKLETWKEKSESTKHVWLEEKEITNSLLQNNVVILKSMEDQEAAIKELSDQVRDLMFFLEAREKVQGHPELEGGNIETHTPQQKHGKRRGKR